MRVVLAIICVVSVRHQFNVSYPANSARDSMKMAAQFPVTATQIHATYWYVFVSIQFVVILCRVYAYFNVLVCPANVACCNLSAAVKNNIRQIIQSFNPAHCQINPV